MEETILRQPKQEPIDNIPLKKAKFIDEKFLFDYQYQAMLLAQYRQAPHSFRPWTQLVPPPTVPLVSAGATKHLPHLPYAAAVAAAAAAASLPYLSQEPPVLQNPERVVRLSECERFEQSYQPNVALKPRIKSVNSSTTSSSVTAASNAIKERERDCSKGRDFECCDADRNLERLQTNSIDIKIKQERPNTPIEETQSPESRMESSPSGVANPTAPISPEGQSGSSNEITSSTSPVPVTASHKQHETTMSGRTSFVSNTRKCRIEQQEPQPTDNQLINHLISRSHHSTKPTTDTHQLQSSHHSSHIRHSISLTNGTYNHHHKFNGVSHLNNSEFELSTDTDDDSLAGEADSSNNIAPLEIAIEALKDTRPQDRDRVLHIIKMLLQENVQMTFKNNKLLQEIRRKDEEINNLLQLNRINKNKSPMIIKSEEPLSITMPAIDKKPVISVSAIAKTVIEVGGSINVVTDTSLPTAATTTTTANVTTVTATPVEPKKKSETEVIRMPLKKSARRSLEETVVIMQPHKLREKAREKVDKLSRFYDHENRSSPSPIHHTSDSSIVSTASSAAVIAESEAKVAANV